MTVDMYHVSTVAYPIGHNICDFDIQSCRIKQAQRGLLKLFDIFSPYTKIKATNAIQCFKTLEECIFFAQHFVPVHIRQQKLYYYILQVSDEKMKQAPLALKELCAIKIEEKKEIKEILTEYWRSHKCWFYFEYLTQKATVKEQCVIQVDKELVKRMQNVYFEDLYNAFTFFT